MFSVTATANITVKATDNATAIHNATLAFAQVNITANATDNATLVFVQANTTTNATFAQANITAKANATDNANATDYSIDSDEENIQIAVDDEDEDSDHSKEFYQAWNAMPSRTRRKVTTEPSQLTSLVTPMISS